MSKAPKTLAVNPRGWLISANVAVQQHRPGDRYVQAHTGKAMRLHKSPRGTMRPHFEYEPRWDNK